MVTTATPDAHHCYTGAAWYSCPRYSTACIQASFPLRRTLAGSVCFPAWCHASRIPADWVSEIRVPGYRISAELAWRWINQHDGVYSTRGLYVLGLITTWVKVIILLACSYSAFLSRCFMIIPGQWALFTEAWKLIFNLVCPNDKKPLCIRHELILFWYHEGSISDPWQPPIQVTTFLLAAEIREFFVRTTQRLEAIETIIDSFSRKYSPMDDTR